MLVKGNSIPPTNYIAIHNNGKSFHIEINSNLFYDASRNPIGIVFIARDITERVISKFEFDTILETTLDGFFTTDLQGKILSFNTAFSKMLGYSYDEMQNLSIPDFEASEKPEETKEHIGKVITYGFVRFDTKHRRKDGMIIDLEISVTYLNSGEGELVVFVRDISERIRHQNEIENSNNRCESLAEQSRQLHGRLI